MTTPTSTRRPRVLLTSGGTKVPIDDVRSITNMSSGTFGAAIARAGLKDCDWDLTFLHAEGSKTPSLISFDIDDESVTGEWIDKLLVKTASDYRPYKRVIYKTFDDYSTRLDQQLALQPDIILLAAAVSDYGVKPVEGKIRTRHQLTIEMMPLPKLIAGVRAKCPKAIIVGFKLLVGSTDDELVKAAYRSVLTNGCDFVVANDLRDIKAGQHRLLLVSDDGTGQPIYQEVKADLAAAVAREATDIWKTRQP